MASPSVLPFPLATDSQIGGRSPSPATLHKKQIRRRESVATFPEGPMEEGNRISYTTPAATTPCSEATKDWMVASDRPITPRNVGGGGPV